MKQLLDNIVWHALTGPQARFSAGGDDARRFARASRRSSALPTRRTRTSPR